MSNDELTSSRQQHPKCYRHDPYARGVTARHWYSTTSDGYTTPTQQRADDDHSSVYAATPVSAVNLSPVTMAPPIGTRHVALWERVSFVPYPEDEFVPPPTPKTPAGELVRVFLGQLPYFVTDMQLSWLCFALGGGHVVSYPERIVKRQPSGERLPTGCIHAYTTEAAVAEMAARMHKRMLIDDTGVWCARNDEELRELSTYVAVMKSDKTARVPGRPYDTVVVQLATSTFVPRNVASKPHLAMRAVNETADVPPVGVDRQANSEGTAPAASKAHHTRRRR